MPGATTFGFPYPLGNDAITDYPAIGLQLAQLLEDSLGLVTLADVTLAAPAASIDIASIPAGYASLELVFALRSDRAANPEDLLHMRFNNNAGGNYNGLYAGHAANGANGITGYAAGTEFVCGRIPGATSTVNHFGIGRIWLPAYSSALIRKTMQGVTSFHGSAAGGNTAGYHYYYEGVFDTSAVLDRILLKPAAGSNFITGSRVSIYGRRV